MIRTTLLIGCSAATIALLGCEADVGLVCEISDPLAQLHVISATEVEAAPRWSLSELWRAAGLREGANLTLPASARVSGDGILAVPDFAVGSVWLFGPDGEWIGSAGHRAEGPGELLVPIAAGWSDMGQLFVLDAGQAKLERFDVSSGATETLSIPFDLVAPVASAGAVGWVAVRGDGVALLEHPGRVMDDSISVRFARGGPGYETPRIAWEAAYPTELAPAYERLSRPEWPRALLGAGPRTWVVAPRSSRYELLVHDRSEEPHLHLCVEDRTVVGQGQEAPSILDEDRVREASALPTSEESALFSRILIDRDDRIWVERTLPRIGEPWDVLYGTPGASLDAISPTGELLARVTMPEGLRFQDALGDTVWSFEVGEYQEVEIIAGQLFAPEH